MDQTRKSSYFLVIYNLRKQNSFLHKKRIDQSLLKTRAKHVVHSVLKSSSSRSTIIMRMVARAFTRVPSLVQPLHTQIEGLAQFLKVNAPFTFRCVVLIGSCSCGQATWRSDIDLIVVLAEGPLNFARTSDLKNKWEEAIPRTLEIPLPVSLNFVLPNVFATQEPAMKEALLLGLPLCDPEQLAQHRIQALKKEAS